MNVGELMTNICVERQSQLKCNEVQHDVYWSNITILYGQETALSLRHMFPEFVKHFNWEDIDIQTLWDFYNKDDYRGLIVDDYGYTLKEYLYRQSK